MRLTRAVVLAVAAWLAVVAVGSTAVWLVISQAGEDVGATDQALVPAAVTPSGGPTPTPGAPPAATAPPTASSSAAPPVRRRTWQVRGGYVVAQCRGSAVGLVAAQPDNGWAVLVGNRGPEGVEVDFEARGEGEGSSQVRATCSAGQPRFSTAAGRGDE